MSTMRLNKVEALLECAAAESSCILFAGQTSDNFVYDGHLTPLTNFISSFSGKKQMPTLIYTLDRQVEELTGQNCPKLANFPRSGGQITPTEVIDNVFDSLTRSAQPTTFIIDFAEALIPDGNPPTLDESRIQQQIIHRALEASFRAQKHLVVLISRIRPVDAAFAGCTGIIAHTITLPEQEEREAAVEIMLNSRNAPLTLAEDMTTGRLSRISGGLNIDAISRLRRLTSPANPLTRDMVLERKKEIIRKQSGGTLTIHDDERDFEQDIAGLAQLKLFVKNARMEENNIRVLLLGPPGTGKTLCATAIARAMDTIPISLAQIKSMWVGESERIFRQAIEIIESNAPVTLILDECDQLSMGSRSGSNMAHDSSSVDTSLRGMLLSWLSDSGSKNGVNIIAMSNNANGVDAAFRDRLTIIPIIEPITVADKAKIAVIQLRRLGKRFDEDGIRRAFSESPRNFTGRQIVKMLGNANRTANQISGGIVGYEAMQAAINGTLRSFGLTEQLMSLRALRFTDETEYLPWVAARLMGDSSAQAPEYLRDCLINGDTGIDQERLDTRINELTNQGF